jgi:hypothetical protein
VGGMLLSKEKMEKENREKLLGYIRKRLKIISNNENELFYNRRWIFARLQLDERKEKNRIKKILFSKDSVRCYHCKRKIIIKKGIELHRKNGNQGYYKENSVLIHRNCHQKLHNIND